MDNFMATLRDVTSSLIAFCFLAGGTQAGGQETNPLPESAVQAVTNSPLDAEQQLRSHLKLQEQLHSTLLAIEQARKESSEETQTSAEILGTRLELLERSLNQHRELQLESLHSFNRTMLIVTASIVGVGLLVLVFIAVSQSRGLRRLEEITAVTTQQRTLLTAGLPSNLTERSSLMLEDTSHQDRSSLLSATIHRLENRIRELEQTAETPLLAVTSPGETPSSARLNGRNGGSPSQAGDHVSVLLSKGQVLLSLGQVENALACFDEAVAASPQDATTHLRRGIALERLKRRAEALASYDRAIDLERSLTQAYLGKGNVFNEQERYAEALECYEQALRSEKPV